MTYARVLFYSYRKFQSRFLGVCHLLLGLASIALGIAAVCIYTHWYQSGYSICCGVAFIFTAFSAFFAASTRTVTNVTAHLSFALLTLVIACIQLAIGIYVATVDEVYKTDRTMPGLCSDSDVLISWTRNLGPVTILIIIVAFFEVLSSLSSAVICWRTICCSNYHDPNPNTEVVVFNSKAPGGVSRVDVGGYSNNAYGNSYYSGGRVGQQSCYDSQFQMCN